VTVIDNAVYVDGLRTENPTSLDETYETLHERDGFAWIGLYRPTAAELKSVATEFELHHLAVEDALAGHQRAKLELYENTKFIVLRPAKYLDETEKVVFGEVHLFVGKDFVVTVRHAESPDLARVRRRLESNPELLARGPQAVLYAVLDQVVDDYAPVVAGLQNDIDEIEDQLFEGDAAVSRRIYELSREVFDFERATKPLVEIIGDLHDAAEEHEVDVELRRGFRDVHDHVLRIVDRVDSFRNLLQNALSVNLALVSQKQNDQVKKISSWAAILFTPTLIGTIYGMNFEYMPELHWIFGYPLAVAAMLGMGITLYVIFKKRGWL
jgi:magnesium transporter